MGPDLLAELAQIDGIVGVKQANSAELQPIDGLAVLAGNDDIYAACLDMGGAGGICVSSHVVGPADAPDVRRARARARQIDASLRDVYETMFITASPTPVKAALNLLGHDAGHAAAADGRGRRGRDRRGARDARAPRAALHGVPGVSGTLRVLPLGGVGEIGKNMTVVEYEGRIVAGRRRPALPDGRADGHRPRAARLRLPARARRRHRGDRHHARPRGPSRLPAVAAARAGGDEHPRHLRRPAHGRDGALQARRAQAARGAARRAADRRRGRAPGRSRSR